MAENLDEEASYIEKHVIIGEMSPCLPVVKEEILNYYDNEFESTPFSVQINREPLLEESESRHFQPLCSGLTNNDNSQNMLLHCNKIILGSKPNRVSSDEENLEQSAKSYQENNEVSIDENYFDELVTSYEPSVVLHDIQSYLYKSKRFCDYCSILFPEPNGYENHVQIFHSEKCSGMSRNESLTERRQHKCTICAKLFVAPHVLRRHLMNIHKLNNANVIENTMKDTSAEVIDETTKETNRKRMRYENTTKEVNAHEITVKKANANVIKNTAKEACATGFENISKETKAKLIENTLKDTYTPKINHASSDLSNTCFHCKKSFDTQKSLIEHLYDILQMKRKNTEIVPVLKSVLFKCNKCDIHFTSSLLAANHAEHMEMLINWKCTICSRIFKKEDELSHERQHSVSNNFLTYNLGDLDVTNILFRCSKCATHFTESNFLYHYRDCGLELTKTVTCKVCNILLDYNLKTLHEFDKHTESKPFTIIQCDVISDNPVKSTVNKSQTRDKLKELLKSFSDVKIVLQKMDSNKINRLTKSGTSEELPKVFQDNEASGKLWRTRLRKSNNTSQKYRLLHGLNRNRPNITDHSVLRRRNLAYSYCKNCKCFITKFKKAVHFRGSCKKLAKKACTCEHCGLILNKASIMTHRRLHMERKDLKLANFRFFNLFNGRSMNPPIPEYPKCTHCAVHFVTKSISDNHICSEVTYHTCHLCEINLSPAAFKLHMAFHQYATNRIKRNTVKNSQSATSLTKGKIVSGENIINSTEKYTEFTHTIIPKNLEKATTLEVTTRVPDENVSDTSENERELTNNLLDVAETELTENLNQEYKINDKTKLDASLVQNKKIPLSRRNMIYSYCETCKCFITKFKKSAHAQRRCNKMAIIACTCEHCGLILNDVSIVTHRRVHEEMKDLKLKNFRFFNLYTGRTMNPPIPEYPKCGHCAVHFLTKPARTNHICSEVAYKTCNICEIKLSEAAFNIHVTFHQYASDRKKIVKTKNLQAATTPHVAKCVANENVSDITEKERELPNNPLLAETELTGNMSQEYKMKDKTNLDASLVENNKIPIYVAEHLPLSRRNMIYSYCKTCKCFITKFKKSAHAQGRCNKMAIIACTCEHCGLILNDASIVTHRRVHEEMKDLKLKNFRFFNLYTGRTMNPPIPEYPKCGHCAVQFLTKAASNNHVCSEVAYKTCNICKMKLSEAAFKLHITFHQYPSDRKKTIISKILEAATTLEVASRVTHETVTDTTENERELLNNPLDVAETELTENLSQEYKINDKTKLDASLVENKKIPINVADHLPLSRRNMVYSYCTSCKCFITKFRKSAHAQGRCKKMAKNACTCEHCGLILNDASIVTHRRLHKEMKDLKLKNFRFFNLYTGRTMNPPIPEYPNCSHCAVQFLTKPARNNHICREVTFKTCNICEIKLSAAAFKLHMKFHQYPSDRKKTIISKNLEAATTLEVASRVTHETVTDTTENERELPNNPLDVAETKLTEILSQEYKINDKTKLDASLVENKKIPINVADHLPLSRRNMIYSYCKTCKCFITKFRKSAHAQGRCKKMAKNACTCEHCGLILNDASIVTHRRLHEEMKDLKLKNFRFFNLYTGRTMNPPIPEYPNCSHCAVQFLTKPARNNHICSEVTYKTCNICEIKLSEAAFKLHMTFHQYPSDRKKTIISKNLEAATTLEVASRITHETVTDTTENERELPNNPLDVAETELTENLSQEYKINDNTKLDASLVENKKIPINVADHLPLSRRNMVYSYCTSCKCFITKFRKSAHAQGRCKKMAKNACTCKHCGLILNDASIVTHRRLHEEMKDLKLKNFRFFNLYTGRTMNPPIPEYPNCSHCAVQFLTKPARNNHICSEVTYKTCNICEIKLSEAAFKLHMTFHQYPSDRKKTIISKNLEAATTLGVARLVTHETISDTTEDEQELSNNLRDVAEIKLTAIRTRRNISRKHVVNKKRLVSIADLRRRNLTYSYCETCKCFVTKFRKAVHVQGRCRKLGKMACTCEYCGLILNSASIVTHRRLHIEKRDLKLKNFRFINLYDGRSTNPPIPDYPKCDHCAVHFLNKKTITTHSCNAEAHQTCYVCEIKLSEATFKLHMTFHQYATDRKHRVKLQNANSTTTLELEKCVTGGNVTTTENVNLAETRLTEINKCKNTSRQYKTYSGRKPDAFQAVNNIRQCTESYMETIHNPLNLTETKQSGHISQDYKMNTKTKLDASLDENKKRPVNTADHLALRKRNMIYSYCETCKCFITKFKKDAHAQGRCFNFAKNACTCEYCGLILNDASIVTHRRLHEERKDLKLKNFWFFNLYTGRSMNPPVPEYPKCTRCAVHFLTEKARNNHICSQQAYQACRLCEIKLSQAAFKLHMNFHQYATDRINRVTPKSSQSAGTLDIEKRVTNEGVSNSTENYIKTIRTPPDLAETQLTADTSRASKINGKNEQDELQVHVTSMNSQSARTLDIENRVTNEDVSNSTENYINPKRTPPDSVETKQIADTGQDSKMNDKNEQDDLQVVNKKRHVNIIDHLALRRRNVTYSYCETCKCFVTKFSKATHVQGRCKILAKNACTCELCGLILSDASVATHRRLHEERKDVKLKHFRFFNLYTGRSMNPPIPEYPKCTQCAVQFLTKIARNNHICSEQSYQMCHLCESKLSEAAFKLHMKFHQYPKDRCKRVIMMNSQSATTSVNEKLLTCENVTTPEKDTELKNNPLNLAETRLTGIRECNTSRLYNTNSGRKLDTFQAVNNKRLNVKYSFCETCKCFITNFKKDAHVQRRCKNMAKIACTCEQCGLVLNSASIVTHRRLHEKITDLKLKNFRFFNLYTGRTTNPPIPEYPKCTHCAVHFLTKTARKDHVCGKDAYQTCHVCEIKLTEAAFLLHMTFHQYATERIKKVVLKNSKPAMTLDIEKPVTNEDECKTAENETELVRYPLDAAETPVQNSSDIYEIVYTCGNCSVSVDTYDKVVEHCQRHYENKDQETQTKVCNYCELTIDAACYTNHENLHEKEKELKLLKFDSYYLPADNNMWVKHIFKTLPKEKVLDILRSSIYRYECRIKMDIIQQGDPNLTVYKCDQCSCFIEPGSLFKHSDNSCFKLRHHPCTVCGIPFNSSASRIDHEKIHNCPGITTDSYRIVIFNRERDKQINRAFCLRKNYVLFQCRKCGVIINKAQGDIHTCDVSNVKKCPQCALLLNSKDFEKHVNTHKEFVSFNYSNMKIVLLGDDNSLKDQREITLRSNFKGAIYDYKMYICNKCDTCVKNEMCMSNHICRYGKQRLKCLKCALYFSVGRLKTHTRSHEQDPDFVRSNMSLVWFDPCTLDQNKNTTAVGSKDCELSDSDTDSDTEILTDDTSITNVIETISMIPEILEEETVKLYKCTCGLHFLNEDSIIRHFGVCRSTTTISKQKCSKCDLLFTQNVLFTHMLAHHSRNSCYKYNVIEIDHTEKNMVQ